MNQVLNILKESDKDVLIERYADLEFVDEVKTLKCIKCGKVAISHFISECNHLFCKCCTNDQLINKWNCPSCQEVINKTMKQNIGIQLRIYGLRLYCPNKKSGCQELATLVEISSHLGKCQYKKATFANINSGIESQIKSVIVSVDQLSSSIIRIEEQQRKTEELLNKTLESIKVDLNQLKKRLGSVERLQQNSTLVTVKNSSSKENTECDFSKNFQQLHIERDIISQQFQKMEKFFKFWTKTRFIWTINAKDGAGISFITDDDMVAVRRLNSPTFIISGQRIEAQAVLMGSGYIYLIFRHFQTTKNLQMQLSNPLPRIIYTVSNKTDGNISSEEPLKCQNATISVEQHIGFIYQFRPGSSEYKTPMVQLIDDAKPFIKGNPIVINITVDYPHLIHQPSSTNGTLEWTIKNFMGNIEQWIYSPYFYTSSQGYRVNIGLSMAKNALIASINFLTGEHDHQLPQTSYFDTTVTLVDQTPSIKYGNIVKFTKSSTSEQANDGIQLWTSYADNDIKDYLKNDAMLLKIQLTTANES